MNDECESSRLGVEEYFDTQSFLLSAHSSDQVKDGDELFMFMDFWSQKVRLSVYDYTDQVYVDDLESPFELSELDDFLEILEEEYQVTVPEVFRERAMQFMSLQAATIVLDVELEESTYCDSCYDFSRNSLEVLYIPGLEGFPPSVSLNHNFGCYSSNTITGDYVSRKDELLKYLKSLRAGEGYSLKPVNDFISRIETAG